MESDLGKLFIGGISWDTNEDRLKDYFRSYGEVVEAIIMKDRSTGRARGFGFVVFADPSVAERVVLERHIIDGRMVEAKKAVPREDQIPNRNSSSSSSIRGLPPSPARTKKIFVGGLPSTVNENDLRRYFDQFGTITDAVVMYDHNTQRPRGFGFVTYDSEDAVDNILFKTFHDLHGKLVEVKRAVPKELSPGPSNPSWSPVSGCNNFHIRVNNFINEYPFGYNTSAVGNYGVRMDPRFTPFDGNRNVISLFGSGYQMSSNFAPQMRPTSIGHGQGMNPSFGYGLGRGGSGSVQGTPTRNVWGNEGLNYLMNPDIASNYQSSETGSIGGSSFGNSRTSWGGSFPISFQGGASGETSYGLGGGGYGRSRGIGVVSTPSYSASTGGFGGSVFGDSTWLCTTSELEEASRIFGYGQRREASDATR